LIEMQESLRNAKIEEEKRKVEDSKQTWATQGIAMFSDILRQKTDNLEEFSYNIIRNLVKYIEANQGGLFVINESDEKQKVIDLAASFAYNRKKFLEKQIKPGEGLIGMSVLEKRTIHLTEIPEGYLEITSGLGHESPRSLLIVPLKVNEEVYGVIEIASFNKFEPYIISFIEKISESIASTLSAVKVNIITTKLLRDSQKQAEELASQEEEMRQNLEELQATQEESARKEAELGGIVNAISSSFLMCEFDNEGTVLSANSEFSKCYGYEDEEIVGMTFKDLLTSSGLSSEKINQIWYGKFLVILCFSFSRVSCLLTNSFHSWVF